MAGGDPVEQLGAGHGVLDSGRGDQHRQEEADRVGHDAPLPAHDLLARVYALTRGGHGGGGLHALRVDHAGRRLRVPPLLMPHQLPQQAIELGKNPVLLPLGEVATDRLPGRDASGMTSSAPLKSTGVTWLVTGADEYTLTSHAE